MTRAPKSAAQRMPRAMLASVPAPSAPSTFTGMMRALGAMPATPRLLPVVAAAMPATCVPCPLSSEASLSSFTKS